MKNRILFISLAVVLALSIGLIGCTGGPTPPERQPSDEIVIGMSRSVTGNLAIIHASAFSPVYTAYLAMVNGAGGVTVDGETFDLDVKVLNDNSSPETLVAHTNTLIADIASGEVHTLFGPTCTYFIDVMSPITNEAECVLMTVEGGGTFLITNPGPPPTPGPINISPYVFINLSFSDWYQIPVLAPLLDEAHKAHYGLSANATAWVVWQDDAHGLEYLSVAETFFPLANISIIGNTPVLNDPTYDYAGELATIAGASPDILCLFCYPNEIYGYLFTAIGTATNFDAVVGGPGACFGIFGTPYAGVGANTEGVITFAVGNNKTSSAGDPIPNATITMEELFNDLIAGGDWAGQDAWGHPLYWAAMEMWQNAVEAVAYVQDGGFMIDQDDLQAELAGYDSESNGVNTVLGKTWYNMFNPPNGGGMMDWLCHTGEIGQWQSGYIEVVAPTQVIATNSTLVSLASYLPNYRATSGTVTYPKPDWTP
jgi:ABC-type branched-subunit amino acid transport system substrate-binding protein